MNQQHSVLTTHSTLSQAPCLELFDSFTSYTNSPTAVVTTPASSLTPTKNVKVTIRNLPPKLPPRHFYYLLSILPFLHRTKFQLSSLPGALSSLVADVDNDNDTGNDAGNDNDNNMTKNNKPHLFYHGWTCKEHFQTDKTINSNNRNIILKTQDCIIDSTFPQHATPILKAVSSPSSSSPHTTELLDIISLKKVLNPFQAVYLQSSSDLSTPSIAWLTLPNSSYIPLLSSLFENVFIKLYYKKSEMMSLSSTNSLLSNYTQAQEKQDGSHQTHSQNKSNTQAQQLNEARLGYDETIAPILWINGYIIDIPTTFSINTFINDGISDSSSSGSSGNIIPSIFQYLEYQKYLDPLYASMAYTSSLSSIQYEPIFSRNVLKKEYLLGLYILQPQLHISFQQDSPIIELNHTDTPLSTDTQSIKPLVSDLSFRYFCAMEQHKAMESNIKIDDIDITSTSRRQRDQRDNFDDNNQSLQKDIDVADGIDADIDIDIDTDDQVASLSQHYQSMLSKLPPSQQIATIPSSASKSRVGETNKSSSMSSTMSAKDSKLNLSNNSKSKGISLRLFAKQTISETPDSIWGKLDSDTHQVNGTTMRRVYTDDDGIDTNTSTSTSTKSQNKNKGKNKEKDKNRNKEKNIDNDQTDSQMTTTTNILEKSWLDSDYKISNAFLLSSLGLNSDAVNRLTIQSTDSNISSNPMIVDHGLDHIRDYNTLVNQHTIASSTVLPKIASKYKSMYHKMDQIGALLQDDDTDIDGDVGVGIDVSEDVDVYINATPSTSAGAGAVAGAELSINTSQQLTKPLAKNQDMEKNLALLPILQLTNSIFYHELDAYKRVHYKDIVKAENMIKRYQKLQNEKNEKQKTGRLDKGKEKEKEKEIEKSLTKTQVTSNMVEKKKTRRELEQEKRKEKKKEKEKEKEKNKEVKEKQREKETEKQKEKEKQKQKQKQKESEKQKLKTDKNTHIQPTLVSAKPILSATTITPVTTTKASTSISTPSLTKIINIENIVPFSPKSKVANATTTATTTTVATTVKVPTTIPQTATNPTATSESSTLQSLSLKSPIFIPASLLPKSDSNTEKKAEMMKGKGGKNEKVEKNEKNNKNEKNDKKEKIIESTKDMNLDKKKGESKANIENLPKSVTKTAAKTTTKTTAKAAQDDSKDTTKANQLDSSLRISAPSFSFKPSPTGVSLPSSSTTSTTTTTTTATTSSSNMPSKLNVNKIAQKNSKKTVEIPKTANSTANSVSNPITTATVSATTLSASSNSFVSKSTSQAQAQATVSETKADYKGKNKSMNQNNTASTDSNQNKNEDKHTNNTTKSTTTSNTATNTKKSNDKEKKSNNNNNNNSNNNSNSNANSRDREKKGKKAFQLDLDSLMSISLQEMTKANQSVYESALHKESE